MMKRAFYSMMKRAFYFGYIEGHGHGVLNEHGRREYVTSRIVDFPWTMAHLDTGLLKNGNHVDRVDGKVFWACARPLWFAFVWWDRSGDSRSNSNSGFYVQGFEFTDVTGAFNHALVAFPKIVSRQKYPLILQEE